jgi:hypothetical protein
MYINIMSSEKQNFNKITQFITDSYNTLPNRGVVVVKSVRNGFMVNNIIVKQNNNLWVVEQNNTALGSFRQRRIAILFAALINRKRKIDCNKMSGFDQQLDIFLEDKNYFSVRLKQKDNPILADRLSRTKNELSLLEQQLLELEKSLGLQ